MLVELCPQPLTRDGFAPFGDVIDADGADRQIINNGAAVRFHALAEVDAAAEGGRPLVNIFRAQPLALPLPIRMMEKHPLGSQAFMPLRGERFLIVVAPPGAAVSPADVHAFISDGRQGVNYARGAWHHPVIAMNRETDFLVIDRGGPGDNLVEVHFGGDECPVLTLPH